MKKIILASAFLLLGFGCNQNQSVTTTDQLENTSVTSGINSTTTSTEVVPPSAPTTGKLAVKRTFTLDEIETTGGGLKNWFRDLARANVAGTKTLVRIPVNHVQGFGCVVPTKYCVSTITGGCYGSFVDLKGNSSIIAAAPGTLWEVEGYVVAASKVPEAKDDGTPGTCADGELLYDFEVTRVIQKIDGGANDEFLFYEYK